MKRNDGEVEKGGEMIGRSRKEVYGGVGVGADKGAE